MSEDGVTRRTAITAAGVVVVGGVAGYVAAKNTDAAEARDATTAANAYGGGGGGGGGGDDKPIAKLADIPDGGGVIKGKLVLTRSGADVHAFSAVCTHQGCVVNKVGGGTIDCPCHGSHFDATTGEVVGGPAPSPLPPIPVTVRNGEVFPA